MGWDFEVLLLVLVVLLGGKGVLVLSLVGVCEDEDADPETEDLDDGVFADAVTGVDEAGDDAERNWRGTSEITSPILSNDVGVKSLPTSLGVIFVFFASLTLGTTGFSRYCAGKGSCTSTCACFV